MASSTKSLNFKGDDLLEITKFSGKSKKGILYPSTMMFLESQRPWGCLNWVTDQKKMSAQESWVYKKVEHWMNNWMLEKKLNFE